MRVLIQYGNIFSPGNDLHQFFAVALCDHMIKFLCKTDDSPILVHIAEIGISLRIIRCVHLEEIVFPFQIAVLS